MFDSSDDANSLVIEPRIGRVSVFTSGPENIHHVNKVRLCQFVLLVFAYFFPISGHARNTLCIHCCVHVRFCVCSKQFHGNSILSNKNSKSLHAMFERNEMKAKRKKVSSTTRCRFAASSCSFACLVCFVFSIFDVPRCCDVWNDLFSDWHRQRVDDCNNLINMLFATQQNIKSNQEAKTSPAIHCTIRRTA